MKNTHLTPQTLEKFYSGALTKDETQEILLHISDCTQCAELFADFIGCKSQVSAPLGLREQVRSKIRTPRQELFIYSLKVTTACAAAIAITFSGIFSYRLQPLKTPDMNAIHESVRQQLDDFSQNIFNGGFFNANQKK